MSGNLACQFPGPVSVADYLEWERQSEAKHEYSGGVVTRVPDASREHELVSGNLAVAVHDHLRGKGCRTFKSDMKLYTEVIGSDIFYYPDIMVACEAGRRLALLRPEAKAHHRDPFRQRHA